MTKLRMGVASAALVAMVSLLCFGALQATEPRQTPPQESPYQTSAEANEPFTIRLDGKGRQATEKFELESGLAIVQVENDGPSNFIVGLLDKNGDQVTNLFNEVDKFQGRRAFNIEKPGAYLLDVQATGAWSFSIQQPRVDGAESAPQTFEGNGMDVTPFVTLPKGLTVIEFQRDGEGRGIFTLLDSAGRAVEQIANELDAFQGSKPVKIQEEGVYFLNVYGDGNWTVKIK